jgi:hypothetical protein
MYPITKSRCVSPTSSTGFAFHGNGGCVAVEGTISSRLLLGLLIELSRLPVGDTSSGHCIAIVVDLSKGCAFFLRFLVGAGRSGTVNPCPRQRTTPIVVNVVQRTCRHNEYPKEERQQHSVGCQVFGV